MSRRVYVTLKCRDLPIVGSSSTTVLLASLFQQENNTWIFKQATQRHRGDRSFQFGGELILDLPSDPQTWNTTWYQISIYTYQSTQAARVSENQRVGSITFTLSQLVPSNVTSSQAIPPLECPLTHDTNDAMNADLASLHSYVVLDADWLTRAGNINTTTTTATTTTTTATQPVAGAAPAPTPVPTPAPTPHAPVNPRSSASASHVSQSSTSSLDDALGLGRSNGGPRGGKKGKRTSLSNGGDSDMELDLDSDDDAQTQTNTKTTNGLHTTTTTQTATIQQPQQQQQQQQHQQQQQQSQQPHAPEAIPMPTQAATPVQSITEEDDLEDDDAEAEAEKFSQLENPDEDGYPELLAKIERMMMKGRIFLRHVAEQAPTSQKVFYRPGVVSADTLTDEVSPGSLFWCEPHVMINDSIQSILYEKKQFIDLETVTDIYLGKQTGAFNIQGGEVGENEDDGVSFTLSSDDKTLDLESHTAKQRAAWIFGIMGILKKTGNA